MQCYHFIATRGCHNSQLAYKITAKRKTRKQITHYHEKDYQNGSRGIRRPKTLHLRYTISQEWPCLEVDQKGLMREKKL